MEITSATRPGNAPGGNEDVVIAGGRFAVLVNTAGPLRPDAHPPVPEICARLTAGLIRRPDAPLRTLLGEALDGAEADYPAALCVAVARTREGKVDLLLRGGTAALIQFPNLTVNEMLHRHYPGRALAGSLPVSEVRRVCLLSEGAHRLAGRCGWDGRAVLDRATAEGPDALLEKMRAAEPAHPFSGASVALCSPYPG
ncbi:hypothetical protein AB0467_27465 [Streptomyces sp. NPDC052095]|uniref:hypothetical protein n=1 Tax=unclassified Streptomyces TaxID=2593676 RepID=UPI00344D31EF